MVRAKSNRRKDPRKDILEAALKVFCEKGYKEASTREIAKRADVSKGLIYFYFKDKQEIYLELASNHLMDFERWIKSVPKDEPLAALENYINSMFQVATKKKKLILLLLKEQDMEFIQEHSRTFTNHQKELLVNILRSGEERGIFRPTNHEETALLIISATRGFLLGYFTNEIRQLKPYAKALLDLILLRVMATK
jgi:AcrR family transcriptional regulator